MPPLQPIVPLYWFRKSNVMLEFLVLSCYTYKAADGSSTEDIHLYLACVVAELHSLRATYEQQQREVAAVAQNYSMEIEQTRRLMEQYRIENERLRAMHHAEIMHLQRQHAQMDFNGRVSSALDSYLRGQVGASSSNTSPCPSQMCGSGAPNSSPNVCGPFTPNATLRIQSHVTPMSQSSTPDGVGQKPIDVEKRAASNNGEEREANP